MMDRFRKRLRLFKRDEKGLAAVEFAMFLPIYLGLFFWAAELGIVMMKSVMLDHALDVAMRDLRLGTMVDPSQEKLKEEICARTTIIGNCMDQLMIELRSIPTNTWAMPNTPVTCVNNDEEIQPVVTFTPGRQHEIMLVRACMVIPVLFPSMTFGSYMTTDSTGGIGISSISAFVNEPS